MFLDAAARAFAHKLHRRQIRSLQFLSEVDFVHWTPDALTRRLEYRLSPNDEAALARPHQMLPPRQARSPFQVRLKGHYYVTTESCWRLSRHQIGLLRSALGTINVHGADRPQSVNPCG
ncbi:hypothetical protein PBRA_009725 [Plasmodiophora brassicae]|uniref:Uncharacterized protein n=1 Tax=Plasmodiophora brassicae TaxID=37360 RepID=A0A0G4ILR1_PLABS|nr:hypothetical protein PBRA_009725 [Plasmodiophora brassicae]